MKKIVIATALLVSSASFAIMAPTGKYIALSCVTSQSRVPFTVQVIKDTRNKKIQMVLEAKGQAPIVYPNVTETVVSRPGAPVTYDAPATAGHVQLSVNFTTAPNPKGRPATFSSAAYGRSTKTPMLCNRVMY